MRFIYTFFFYLLLPFILIRLYWKSRRLPAYWQRLHERFFWRSPVQGPVDVWLHAVSLGEVVAATPLIDELLKKDWRILVTTMTPTGSAQLSKRFGQRIQHCYLPYDLPQRWRKFFKILTPRLGLIMETEIWPNLIHEAKRAKMPLLLINARLSDRSFKSYQKIAWFLKSALQELTGVFAQSEEDAQRFIALGTPKQNVQMMGNMKFDVQWQVNTNHDSRSIIERCGSRCVLIAASTHDDEEKQILSRLKILKQSIPDLLLLIAARHPERFQTVYQESLAHGFDTGLRSCPEALSPATDVVIIDSLGELMNFYQVSDYAFVGGSLITLGGHNVLEPIAVQVPVFCGPHMQNSKSICRELLAAKAMVMASDADDLIHAIIALHKNPSQRQQQISNATAVLAANQGTVKACMDQVQVLMS
jgi:3-deoxy-D-manno-octulosonic-acid transferase